MRKSTKFNYEVLKKEKGTICINCLSDEKEIQYHHVIPLSLGGQDILSNIVPLCEDCHNLIHHAKIKKGNLSHSELIKAGINKAKAEGKQPGRKSTTIKDIPENFLKLYDKIKNKEITIMGASRELGLSRPTIYKYINLLEKSH